MCQERWCVVQNRRPEGSGGKDSGQTQARLDAGAIQSAAVYLFFVPGGLCLFSLARLGICGALDGLVVFFFFLLAVVVCGARLITFSCAGEFAAIVLPQLVSARLPTNP